MGCCEGFPLNPLEIPGWMIECILCVVLEAIKSFIDAVVGFFEFLFQSIANGIIFFILAIQEGFVYIFDLFYAGMEWILGQFGITAPVIMAVAVVVFMIFVVFSVRMLMWLGERLYELL